MILKFQNIFFFQAEDGIRDHCVTGVQTCALPIFIAKNTLFFDRWRPQNETYLFGFRKHEQGQNAKEIPMFDPLISQQEAEIAKLRTPRKHLFEITADRPHLAGSNSVATGRVDHELKRTNPDEQPQSPSPMTNSPLPGFDIAPGFEVNLFAESPLLAKPTE